MQCARSWRYLTSSRCEGICFVRRNMLCGGHQARVYCSTGVVVSGGQQQRISHPTCRPSSPFHPRSSSNAVGCKAYIAARLSLLSCPAPLLALYFLPPPQLIQRYGLLGSRVKLQCSVRCLPPPVALNTLLPLPSLPILFHPQLIQRYGLLGSRVQLQSSVRCLPPPMPLNAMPPGPYGQMPGGPGMPMPGASGPSWGQPPQG